VVLLPQASTPHAAVQSERDRTLQDQAQAAQVFAAKILAGMV